MEAAAPGDSSNELVISGSTSTGLPLIVVFVLSISLIVISLRGDWAISKHIPTFIENSLFVSAETIHC